MKFSISLVLYCVVSKSFLINALDTELGEKTTIFLCSGVHLPNEKLEVPENVMHDKESYSFRLQNSPDDIDCSFQERFDYSVNFNDINGTSVFTQSGIITVIREENLVIHRNITEYCVLSFTENSILTLSVCDISCEKKTQNDRPCINKCCPLHKILGYDSEGQLRCLHLEKETSWKPVFFRDTYTPLSDKEQTAIQPHYYSFSLDDCEMTTLFVHKHKNHQGEYNNDVNPRIFRFLLNGALAFCSSYTGEWMIMNNENYCMDGIRNFGDGNNSDSGDLVSHAVYRCINNSRNTKQTAYAEARESALITVLYHIIIPIDLWLLFIVIIVYVLLWQKQNIHGYTIISYVITLFCLYLTLSISVTMYNNEHLHTQQCKVVGVILHFLFIATFCWLTALSFDIWWTFRNLKICSESKNVRKFLLYVLFCVSIPVLIISIGLATDNADKIPCSVSDYELKLAAPHYGERVCGVSSKAQGWFIYFPAGILLGCNAIFFVLTVRTVQQYRKSTDVALQGKCTKEDKPIWIFFKLFIVMGVCWILEFIAWGVKEEHDPNQKTTLIWLVLVFDIFNLLQPFAIFYIFVCKRVIYVQLWQNHIWLRSLLRLCVLTGCCDMPAEKRPSFLTSPHSTLVRSSRHSSLKTSIRRSESLSQKSRKISITAITTAV